MTTTIIERKVVERIAKRKELQKHINLLQYKINNFQKQKMLSKKPEVVIHCNKQIKSLSELKAKMELALRAA